MFSIAFNRPLAAIAVVGGLLVAAAPAGAKVEIAKDQSSSAFFGDAYINEMGITGAGYQQQAPRADGIIAILIGAVGTNDIEPDN